MKLTVATAVGLVALAGPAYAEDEGPVQLESTFVGDKEQPSVSYFIPWQATGTPDNLYRNIEGHYDQSLQPIDRDVLLRSMKMYDEMGLEKANLSGK